MIDSAFLSKNKHVFRQDNDVLDAVELDTTNNGPKRYFESSKWKQIQTSKDAIEEHYSEYVFDQLKLISKTNYINR